MQDAQDPQRRSPSPVCPGSAGPSVYRCESGELRRADGSDEPPGPAAEAAGAALRAFIDHPEYPCVGAKAALARESFVIGIYDELGAEAAPGDTRRVAEDLSWFAARSREIDEQFATFVAMFRRGGARDERDFERRLWGQLQAMHEHDRRRFAWDDRVSDDPAHPDFRYSMGGEAFFVIGLHPAARREARRFAMPALVFNLHTQFQALREDGRFETMRSTIREREEALEGEANPFLADHGEKSEAAQYAGRDHDAGWTPPFRSGGSCPFANRTKRE